MRRKDGLIPSLFWLSCAAAGPKPAAAPDAAPHASGPATTTALAPVAASPAPVPDAKFSLPDPDWLPREAREMLTARMERHGEEMMLLLVSVLTLHHEDSELLADHVAAEPRLGRPGPSEEGTISALLPARFFGFQDELIARARALAAAARAKDDARIVRAYGQLAETCVSCHSVYLTPDSEFELPAE